VGFVARLAPEKSPGLFVRAAALVAQARPSVRFVVVGDGPMRVHLEALADRLGVGPAFTFVGWVTPEDQPKTLRGIDVLVNPSLRVWSETFCIANIEAMATGVPLVSCGIGGIGEYLAHDVNGVFVDTAAPQGIADAVVDLLADPAKRARLGAAARSWRRSPWTTS